MLPLFPVAEKQGCLCFPKCVLILICVAVLNQPSDLRAISTDGQIVFGHFSTTSNPNYEVVFTMPEFEHVTSNSRQALLVALQSSLKVLGIMLIFCSAELDLFSSQYWRSNCSISRVIKAGFCFGNVMQSLEKSVVCFDRGYSFFAFTLHIWKDRCRMCLFGASWLCSLCGKDFCSLCLAEVKVALQFL